MADRAAKHHKRVVRRSGRPMTGSRRSKRQGSPQILSIFWRGEEIVSRVLSVRNLGRRRA